MALSTRSETSVLTSLPIAVPLPLPRAVSLPERIGASTELPDPTELPFRMSPLRTSTLGANTVVVSVVVDGARDEYFEVLL